MKRNIPLFIIDSSRAHGRARETDFVACTSRELPWYGEITLLNVSELAIDQDWSSKNPLCHYSDPNPVGIRAKLKVASTPVVIDNSNKADLQSLMRRCMKEWLARRAVTTVDMNNVSNEAVVKLADSLLEQTWENLRANPKDETAKAVASILAKIKNDYSNK